MNYFCRCDVKIARHAAAAVATAAPDDIDVGDGDRRFEGRNKEKDNGS